MQIEIYIMYLIFLLNVYSLLFLLLIFIQNQSQRYSEIKPKHNWHYREASSSTNDYRGQQERLYDQLATYKKRQTYSHDRTTRKVTSINVHERGKVDN